MICYCTLKGGLDSMSKNLNHFKISRVLGLSQHWSCRDWLFDNQDSKLVKAVKNCLNFWDYWQVETLLTCKRTSQGNVNSFKIKSFGYVSVSPRSHLGIVLVLSWSHLSLILISSRSRISLVSPRSHHALVSVLHRPCLGLVFFLSRSRLVSSRSRLDLDLVSSRGCQYFGFLWDWRYDCQGPSG